MTGRRTDTDITSIAMQNLRSVVNPQRNMSTNKVSPEKNGALVSKERGVDTSQIQRRVPPGPPPDRPDLPWREDAEYDPFADRTVKRPYSNLGAGGHLLKGAMGAGLLAIPYGFMKSGVALGVVSGIIVAIICTHCCRLLVINSRKMCKRLCVPSMDFATTVEAAFLTAHARLRKYARICRFMVNFLLCFTYLGLPIIFIVVISTSIQQLVEFYLNTSLALRYYVLMLLPFVLAMGMIPELKWLIPFSQVSNLLILTGLSVTMYYVLKDAPNPLSLPQVGTLEGYPLFLSAIIYGMENVGVILPVENTMRHPSQLLGRIGVLNWSMFLIAFFYIFIGAAGYVTFGEKTNPNIILNLPTEEPLARAVKILIPLGILMSYGLQLYVVPLTLWSGTQHHFPPERHGVALAMLRAGVVLFTVVIALLVPNLRPVLGLVGAIGFSSLGLFFPALIDIIISWPADPNGPFLRWNLVKNIAILLFWLVALLSGTYSSILEIIDTYFSKESSSL